MIWLAAALVLAAGTFALCYWGFHVKTIRRYIHEGRLRAVDIGTKGHPDYRIHKDELKRLLVGGKRVPKPRKLRKGIKGNK